MARINIEDNLFADGRFVILKTLLGSEETAIGKLVIAWRTAQSYWKQDMLIPLKFWEILKLDELIETDFAEAREDGVYVRGVEKHFEWIKIRQDAGKKGGVASGKSRNEAKTKQTGSKNEAKVDFSLNENEAKTKPLTLTLTPPLTHNTNTSCQSDDDVSFVVKANSVAEMWNMIAKEEKLSIVKVPLSKDRLALLRAPMAEFSSSEDWSKIIAQVPVNPFNTGANERKWKANFDWLIHKTKFNYRKLWEEYESQNS